MKILYPILIVVLFAAIVAMGGLYYSKITIADRAAEKVAAYLDEHPENQDRTQTLLNSTLFAYNTFKAAGESTAPKDIFYKLKPYTTHDMLPGNLKTSKADFNIVYPTAENENSAVQILAYILAKQDMQVFRWRVISPKGEKSAAIVQDEGGVFSYLDPASGVVAMYDNQIIIGPYAAQDLMMDNLDHRKIFVKLAEDSDISFYEEFAHVMMAPPGFPLRVNVAAPVLEEPLKIGDINNNAKDVAENAAEWDLTPYFDYIGYKHGKSVQRSMYFTEAAKITFVITDDVDPNLIASNIEPTIDGQNITFEVPAEKALMLEEAQERSAGFMAVDQIIIEQL